MNSPDWSSTPATSSASPSSEHKYISLGDWTGLGESYAASRACWPPDSAAFSLHSAVILHALRSSGFFGHEGSC